MNETSGSAVQIDMSATDTNRRNAHISEAEKDIAAEHLRAALIHLDAVDQWAGFNGAAEDEIRSAMRVLVIPERPGVIEIQRVVAANEALKLLRKRHYPVQYVDRQRCCVSCFDASGKPHLWPCPDAELIYPTEELP